jgi:hypothetical protein
MRHIKNTFSWHNRVKSVKSLFHPILLVGLSVNGLLNKNMIFCIGIIIVRLISLIRKNGMTFTAKYLKSCGLFVMKSVGMKKKSSLHSGLYKETKVSICRDGLPRIIPSYLRNQIRNNNSSAIRLVLSIFNLYRVLPYPGKVKLETIVSSSSFQIRQPLDNYIPRFLNLVGVYDQPFIFNFNPFPIRSAGSVIEFSEELNFYDSKGHIRSGSK